MKLTKEQKARLKAVIAEALAESEDRNLSDISDRELVVQNITNDIVTNLGQILCD